MSCVFRMKHQVYVCILFILISCSMSCTVRKTRLSDWCQDSSDWLWHFKCQSVKIWCWHVRRNTHRGVDCVSWSGWFWSKLVDFHHGLLVSEVWNRIIKSKQRLYKTDLSSQITSINFTLQLSTKEYQSFVRTLPWNFHFSASRWVLSGYESKCH